MRAIGERYQRPVLVIGSNSFCGSHFSGHLLRNGYEVVGVSRSEEPQDVFLPYKWTNAGGLKFQFSKIDINTDLEELVELIELKRPAYIANFSAQGMVSQSWDSPEDWYRTNLISQIKIFESIRRFDFLVRYLHFTTPEVYGNTEGWITEKSTFNPSTPYAVSRAACDMHLLSYFRAYSFPVVFTRAANVYGPGQQLYRIIPKTILCARLGKTLDLHGGGHSIRSFIHIEDVCRATLSVLMDGHNGDSYHISTKELVSIRMLVGMVCRLLGVSFSDLTRMTEDRLGKDYAYQLDSEKIRDEFHWEEQKNLEGGLRETISWVDESIDVLKRVSTEYEHKK